MTPGLSTRLVASKAIRTRVHTLENLSVLIVESEFLIALEIQRILEAAGVREVSIVPSVKDALSMLASPRAPGAVIASGWLDRDPQDDLLDALRRKDTAFIVVTADSQLARRHPELAGVPIVQKPFADEEIVAALANALAAKDSSPAA